MFGINSFKRLPVDLPEDGENTILRVKDTVRGTIDDIETNHMLLWANFSNYMKNRLDGHWPNEVTDSGKIVIPLVSNYSLVEHVCSHPKVEDRPEYRPPSLLLQLMDAYKESDYLCLPAQYYGDKCIEKFNAKIRAANCNAVDRK